MSLIDEKNILYEKAQKQCGSTRYQENGTDNSFYLDYNQIETIEEIQEYYFDTPIELRNMLKTLWKDNPEMYEKYNQVVTVAAFKNRKEFKRLSNNVSELGQEELPDFVYNF